MAISLHVTPGQRGSPLFHFWSVCVGAGRANEGLRAGWLEQMRLAKEQCGFRYVRFHGLFHDDMFVYREGPEGAVYNFQYIDDLVDRLLDIGMKPFVEFGFCPGDLATEKGTVFWWKGHGSPPKDYGKWAELIRRTAAHWIERYGIEEVGSWYFEVWNEPNLSPFFRGTKSQYFELYKVTAQTLKAVDPRLRVGGPSTSNFVPDGRFDGETEDLACQRLVLEAPDIDVLDWQPVWVREFLAYCDSEKLPVDCVSCHPYPTDWALDEHAAGGFRKNTREVGATPRDLRLLREIVTSGPFPHAEIHLTEWSSSSSPRDFTHDFLQAATYVVRANLESAGSVDSLSYWTFTDVFEEGGAGDTIFHGGFGMINYQGIVKPVFHAYRFLNALGDELLAQTDGGVVTRERKSGKIRILAWHYPPEVTRSVPASFDSRATAWETLAAGELRNLSIVIEGLQPHSAFSVETLDRGHGSVMDAYAAEPATREEIARLKESASGTRVERIQADASGRLSLGRSMTPWSLVFLAEEGGAP